MSGHYGTSDNQPSFTVDIPAKPWKRKTLPRRILAIRLQAMGDLVASLPYLQYLRNSLPQSVKIDLLTREETEDIPRNIFLFDKIFSIGGGRRYKLQFVYAGLLLPQLIFQRYDVVLDLQNNMLSRLVRKALVPKAWTQFDRFSPIAGGERYRLTIEAVGLGKNGADNNFRLKDPQKGEAILRNHGWDGKDELVVLNPAAFFETRNWSLPNYVAFAKLWLSEFPQTRFLVLGTSFIASKAAFLKEQLGDRVINIVGQTTPSEAIAVLQHVKLILSEDSGLMHMAWCSGVPTMGLFGGTRTDWVRPLGEHTFFLDASDLPCGGCMQAVCKYGDVHCLTRFTPEQVFQHSLSLIQKLNKRSKNLVVE
jgi:heptosyltransferase-2